MRNIALKVLLLTFVWSLWAGTDAYAMPCTSSGGCADCENGADNVASCITVNRDAFCDCTISANNRSMCIMADACDYTGATGGGGGGTGGSSGGGTTCTRPASGWCPAECTSCGTVYWY